MIHRSRVRRHVLVLATVACLAALGGGHAVAGAGIVAHAPAALDAQSSAPREVGVDNWHDFDNDGFHDLVIGLPAEDVGSVANAGAVQVIYAADDPGLTERDQIWHQDSAPSGQVPVPNTAETGDKFGAALAVGDFNNDGYGDLAVGAPGEDLGSTVDAGMVHLFYGSATGLQTALTGQPAGTIGIPNVQDDGVAFQLGATLAALDAYPTDAADGYADLAIGIPGADVPDMTSGLVASAGSPRGNAVVDAGGVFFFSGTADGIVLPPPGAAAPRGGGSSVDAFALCGEEPIPGDRCGSSLAAGDFGKDDIDDIAMGTPLHDFTNRPDAGAVWVDYAPFDEESVVLMYAQGGGGVKDTRETGDRFGTTLAAGNLTDESQWDELAVGVPFEDVVSGGSNRVDAGIVQTFLGTTTGLFPTPVQLFSQDSTDMVASLADTVEAGDRFGSALAVGGLGKTNEMDLAIGVPREDLNGKADVGAVHVLYGAADGVQITGSQFFRQGQGGLAGTQAAGDRFGSALTSAEIGHNTYDDLVIGVPFDEVVRTGTTFTDAGAIHALYGKLEGLSTEFQEYLTQDSTGIADKAEAGDRFGGVLR